MKDQIDDVLNELLEKKGEVEHFIIIVGYRDRMPLAYHAPLNKTMLRTSCTEIGQIERQLPALIESFAALKESP